MHRRTTLLINQQDIKKTLTLRESIRAVEKVFKAMGEGRTQMPSKIYLHLDKEHGDFRAMPAAVEGLAGCSMKWVNVHPGNKRKGLPSVMAVLILSDPKTGYPLCIMDATYITAIRTAAAGSVAAKYLARKDAAQVAIIGCGVQARYQWLALNQVMKLKSGLVCGASYEESRRFVKAMAKETTVPLAAVRRIKDCVATADIIITATPSKRPLIQNSWVGPGTHINAIGADARGKQELDPMLLKRGKIIVDSWEQAAHSGEINVPLRHGRLQRKDVLADIGQIVLGKKKGRTSDKDITIFDSTGLAIQDTALAHLVYGKIKKRMQAKSFRFI